MARLSKAATTLQVKLAERRLEELRRGPQLIRGVGKRAIRIGAAALRGELPAERSEAQVWPGLQLEVAVRVLALLAARAFPLGEE